MPCVVLITERSLVQIQPPQPIVGARPLASEEAGDFHAPRDTDGPLAELTPHLPGQLLAESALSAQRKVSVWSGTSNNL